MNFPSSHYSSPGSVFTESPIRDLEAVVRSRTPLIVMESNEEPQIVRMARQIAQRQQLKAFRWTVTEGLQALDPADQPLLAIEKSHDVLNYIKNSASNALFVLLDFHPYLQDAVHVRHLKDIALNLSQKICHGDAGGLRAENAGGIVAVHGAISAAVAVGG